MHMKQDPDFFSCTISPTFLIRMFHKRKTLLIKNHRMFHKRKTLLIKNHIYRLYCCPKGTTLFICRHIHTHTSITGTTRLYSMNQVNKYSIQVQASVTHSHASAVPADPTWIILSPANQLCLVGSLSDPTSLTCLGPSSFFLF